MKPIYLLLAGLALVIYGYVCRAIDLYFFWDSRIFGWLLIIAAGLVYLFGIRRTRKQEGKRTIWATIGIIFFGIFLVLLPIIIIILRNSNAFAAATQYISSSPELKEKLGEVKGFGLAPTGSVEIQTNEMGETGQASLNITVMGDKKYMDLTVDLIKEANGDWKVVSLK